MAAAARIRKRQREKARPAVSSKAPAQKNVSASLLSSGMARAAARHTIARVAGPKKRRFRAFAGSSENSPDSNSRALCFNCRRLASHIASHATNSPEKMPVSMVTGDATKTNFTDPTAPRQTVESAHRTAFV